MGACQSIKGITQSPSIALGPTPSILPRKEFDDVRERFEFMEQLCKGSISVVHRVKDKHSGVVYACKSISKLKVCSQQELKDVQQEIKVFKHVSTGHPNIAQFVQSYEDMTNVHIIMEVCTGGDLFDHILREKTFSEAAAAGVFRSVMSTVQHCHAMNVVHRDIKPEAFMYLSDAPDAPLKAVDFGCAAFIHWDAQLDEIIGSPHYVAPDMLRGAYGRETDIWSCGVLLYVLLCGYPPFSGNTNDQIFEQIVSCPLNLKSEPWPRVSKGAKELVRKMLMRDPKRRLTADQVLQHPWFSEQAACPAAPSAPMVLLRMRQFAQFNRLKKEALKVIVKMMPEAELEGMHNVFKAIDRDADGSITVDELRRGLKAQGANLGVTEVSQVLEGVDLDGNHVVDYLEFLAATMKDLARVLSDREKQEKLMQAFKHFDLDNSGHITVDELKMVLSEEGKELSDDAVRRILVEVDKDKDGKIDFHEFSLMLVQSTPYTVSRRLRVEPQLSRKLREVPLSDVVQEMEDRASAGTGSIVSVNLSMRLSGGLSSIGSTSGMLSTGGTSSQVMEPHDALADDSVASICHTAEARPGVGLHLLEPVAEEQGSCHVPKGQGR